MISFAREPKAVEVNAIKSPTDDDSGPFLLLPRSRRLFQSNVDGSAAAGLRHFYDCFGRTLPLTHLQS